MAGDFASTAQAHQQAGSPPEFHCARGGTAHKEGSFPYHDDGQKAQEDRASRRFGERQDRHENPSRRAMRRKR
jgi:hypothetical protein